MRWGLVPAKIADPDSFKSFTTTNARAEGTPTGHYSAEGPVILHPRDYDRWLTEYDESRPPIDLLRPYEADGMRMTPANRAVGNVKNNGPEMLNSA
jgi:putative SOS response-associated peptidase YedK